MITVKGKKTASKAGKTEKSSTVSVAAANEKNPDNGDHNRGILSSLWRSLSGSFRRRERPVTAPRKTSQRRHFHLLQSKIVTLY
jgi:hypothetical protein